MTGSLSIGPSGECEARYSLGFLSGTVYRDASRDMWNAEGVHRTVPDAAFVPGAREDATYELVTVTVLSRHHSRASAVDCVEAWMRNELALSMSRVARAVRP